MSSPVSKVVAMGLLSLLLSACGDAYQSVQMGPWKLAGTAVVPKGPPESHRTKFRLTTLEAGPGSEVAPGTLVHARITGKVLPAAEYPAGARLGPIDDVWFWIGVADLYFDKDRPALYLGSDELRAAFVGARSGSRLSLVLDPVPLSRGFRLPKKGFLLDYTKAYRMSAGADSEYVEFTPGREYEFNVITVCRGTLLQRQGVLKQWGYIPHVWAGSVNYPFAREGILEWAAVEADCNEGKQKIRLENGPAYRRGSFGTLDDSWPESYERAVSKGRVTTTQ